MSSPRGALSAAVASAIPKESWIAAAAAEP